MLNTSRSISTSNAQYDWRELLRNWSVPCPTCRQVGILRTDRECIYQCRHCGHVFDIRLVSFAQNSELADYLSHNTRSA